MDIERVLGHRGHAIEIATYGAEGKPPANVAIECADCFEVIWDTDLDELDN